MSAPPRSFTELRPLRRALHGRPDAAGRRAAPGPTATLFARVDLVGLLADGRAHAPRARDPATGIDGEWSDLAEVVALLRTLAIGGPPLRAAQSECLGWPFERLHEEFLARVPAISVAKLPPLLLARPLSPNQRTRRRVTPVTAVRLLAGTTGGLFIRSRAPSAAVFLDVGSRASFDYYLPCEVGLPEEESKGE
jgi:hypothetical protein